MATGQDLLNTCEVLDNELHTQPGEVDVTRVLRALNLAQDYFEAVLSQHPAVFGDEADVFSTNFGTFAESTPWPAGVLRIDRLQWIDPADSLPKFDLIPLYGAGSHAPEHSGILNDLTVLTRGRPRYYWTNGRLIYFNPLPDQAHTIRWYGLKSKADVAVSSTYSYPDHSMLPLATFAVRLLQAGVDDDEQNYQALAGEVFEPTIAQMTRYLRDRPPAYRYRFLHTE